MKHFGLHVCMKGVVGVGVFFSSEWNQGPNNFWNDFQVANLPPLYPWKVNMWCATLERHSSSDSWRVSYFVEHSVTITDRYESQSYKNKIPVFVLQNCLLHLIWKMHAVSPTFTERFDIYIMINYISPVNLYPQITRCTFLVWMKSCAAVGELVHALISNTWKNTFTLPCSHVSNNTCTDTYMHTQTHTPLQSGLLQTHIPYWAIYSSDSVSSLLIHVSFI